MNATQPPKAGTIFQGWVGGENERHSRATRGGGTRRQRQAPCCDAQHRAKPEAQVLRGKELDQKEPQLVAEVVASKEQQILVSRWREEIKLSWAQKMAPKEALVVRLLVNLRTSCKVEDTCSLAVRSLACGRAVSPESSRGEGEAGGLGDGRSS